MSTVERFAGVNGVFTYELNQVPAGVPAMTIYSNAARTVVAVASVALVATANPSVFTASYPAGLAAGTYYLSFVTVVTVGQPAFVDNDDTLVLLPVVGGVDDDSGPYGAKIAGIEGLLPWRTFEEDTSPNRTEVLGYLAAVGARVRAKVGALADIVDPARREDLIALAAAVVELGAAARAEAAANPEMAEGDSVSNYAGWLQRQFDEALADLVAAYEALVEEGVEGVEGVGGEPGWAFPEPAGLAIRGI